MVTSVVSEVLQKHFCYLLTCAPTITDLCTSTDTVCKNWLVNVPVAMGLRTYA